MRKWIEEGVEIMGIRWLTREQKPGKVVCSLVIHTKSAVERDKLTMGRKLFTRQDMTGIIGG